MPRTVEGHADISIIDDVQPRKFPIPYSAIVFAAHPTTTTRQHNRPKRHLLEGRQAHAVPSSAVVGQAESQSPPPSIRDETRRDTGCITTDWLLRHWLPNRIKTT